MRPCAALREDGAHGGESEKMFCSSRVMRVRVTAALAVACLMCPAATVAEASEVWVGLDYTFTKAPGANWTLPENQDRITDLVWITRGNLKGIYNIAQEDFYQGTGTSGPSPVDTEWAFGTTADLGGRAPLIFNTWAMQANGSPPNLIGQDMVAHLITDDIYMDIQFLSWGAGFNGGGSFSYIRAVAPEPGTLSLLVAGLLSFLRRRRR